MRVGELTKGREGRVLLVGHLPASAPGGLSWYQGCLHRQLNQRSLRSALSFRVVENEPSPLQGDETEKTVVVGSRRWRTINRVCMRLAARPQWHLALEWFAEIMSRSCWRDLENLQIDAVHYIGTGRTWLGFPLLRLARKMGARFTVLPAVHPNSWGDDQIDLRLYQKADAVFCLSDVEAKHLVSRGLDRAKIQRSGLPPMCRENGDGERLRQRFQLGTRPTVLFLGRRDVGKGYFAVREAWSLVTREVPEAVLMLAGPQGTETKPMTGDVIDLGMPGENQKADALAACDVFCLPSAQESFGIVYVEAWSYDKPVICGTAAASRELVENGETGLWANHDPRQLAEKIIHLLKNREESRRMGEAGKVLQRARYTAETLLEAHGRAWWHPSAVGEEVTGGLIAEHSIP